MAPDRRQRGYATRGCYLGDRGDGRIDRRRSGRPSWPGWPAGRPLGPSGTRRPGHGAIGSGGGVPVFEDGHLIRYQLPLWNWTAAVPPETLMMGSVNPWKLIGQLPAFPSASMMVNSKPSAGLPGGTTVTAAPLVLCT